MRSQSASSDYQDFDEDDAKISRSRLNADAARAQFEPTRIDAKDVDFSDRVNGKRKSYKVSTRRGREIGGAEALGDFSDEVDSDDDGEGLERRMARLRREIEEVRVEMQRRQEHGKVDKEADNIRVGSDEADRLGKLLEGLSTGASGIAPESGTNLAKALATRAQALEKVSTKEEPVYSVTYAPDFQQTHDAARVAAFDSRLTQLERALGITSAVVPTTDPKGVPVAVLPSLDNLQRQIAVLLESTPASLDNINRRVRTLTQEAERLDEARRSAIAARRELRESGADGIALQSGEQSTIDEEHASKINALYGTLSTIEGLAPLLPSLLDRLRSLRTIHADAAAVHERMEAALRKQEDMSSDLRRWREGLEKVEDVMAKGETTMGKNVQAVEGWVKELEARLQSLAA